MCNTNVCNGFFFFIPDPYSVKRNVARTLNSQPVFEYILHCLRTTYKYFALPHKITKPSLPKPLSTVTCSEHSKEVAKDDPDLQAKNDKLKNSVVVQGPSAPSSTANTCKVQPVTLKETAESLGSPPAEGTGSTDISVQLGNSDCIKVEVTCDDHEDVNVHHGETGSKAEKEKIGREGKHPLTADAQDLSSSKHGEPLTSGSTGNTETDCTLGVEGFQSSTAKECDGFATLDNNIDVDEESLDVDELEDSLSHFAPLRRGQTSGVIHSDEEEEEGVTRKEEEDDGANEDGLDNAYTRSGDEDALSEEDEEVGESKYEDSKECGKDVDGALLTELNKISLKEENECEGNSTMDPSNFYEFSKLTFTKGKVGNQCLS